jgi:hypothetical protein
MNSKTLLALGLCAFAASIFSGCATQKTRTGRNNTFFGGLAEVNTGSYIPSSPLTIIPLDGTQFLGRVNPSGDEFKLFWGAISCTDY